MSIRIFWVLRRTHAYMLTQIVFSFAIIKIDCVLQDTSSYVIKQHVLEKIMKLFHGYYQTDCSMSQAAVTYLYSLSYGDIFIDDLVLGLICLFLIQIAFLTDILLFVTSILCLFQTIIGFFIFVKTIAFLTM